MISNNEASFETQSCHFRAFKNKNHDEGGRCRQAAGLEWQSKECRYSCSSGARIASSSIRICYNRKRMPPRLFHSLLPLLPLLSHLFLHFTSCSVALPSLSFLSISSFSTFFRASKFGSARSLSDSPASRRFARSNLPCCAAKAKRDNKQHLQLLGSITLLHVSLQVLQSGLARQWTRKPALHTMNTRSRRGEMRHNQRSHLQNHIWHRCFNNITTLTGLDTSLYLPQGEDAKDAKDTPHQKALPTKPV